MHATTPPGATLLAAAAALFSHAGCLGADAPGEREEAALQQAQPAAASPNPGVDAIGQVTALGPGCPAGTVTVIKFPEGAEVGFDQLALTRSPGEPSAQTTSCVVELEIVGVAGWSHALKRTDVRGIKLLRGAAQASVDVAFGFAGASPPSTSRVALTGTPDTVWSFEPRAADQSWSACGASRRLVASIQASLVSPNGPAVANVTGLGVTVAWRPCRP